MTRRAAGVLLAATAAAALALTACTGSSTSGDGTGTAAAPSTSISTVPTTTPASPDTPTVDSSPAPTSSSPAPSTAGFRGVSATFVGTDSWVLGTSQCDSGKCAALLHSSGNGGWTSLPVPATTGFTGVRFASAQTGYLFGPSALYLTTDGGQHWTQQDGGAVALEALDGNVIRVSAKQPGGCPPGCTYVVQTAPVGSSDWTTRTLPGNPGEGDDVTLGRADGQAYLVDFGNPAGGANDATSVLWTSTDDGKTWANQGEPCPQPSGGETDTTAISPAPDGSLGVLCTVRGQDNSYVLTSDVGAHHFRTGSKNALGAALISAFGVASAQTVFVSSDQLYRSTNAGDSFSSVLATRMSWIGFATPADGHALSADGSALWSTGDAGAHWTRSVFS